MDDDIYANLKPGDFGYDWPREKLALYDLCEALGRIIPFLQLLEEETDPTERKQHLQIINDDAKFAMRLARMLYFSKCVRK